MSLVRQLSGGVVAAALFIAGGVAAADDVIKIGIFPRKPAAETRVAFDPIAKRLAAATGKRVELRLTGDYKAFWEGVKRREYDLVHYSQVLYLKSHKELGYDAVLVNEEQGSPTLRSAIAVRVDGGFRSLADLKGKKILFAGSKQAMQGYIGQVHLLKQAGLREGDYEEAFAVNTPNALIGAYNKAADAAAIGHHLINHASVKSKIDTTQMKILAQGDPLPGLAWAVRRELDPGLVRAIVKTMADLKDDAAGRELLTAADVTGFIPMSDKDFDPVRKAVREAIGEEY
jgi:phosphonate transport system substrate-binding protein